MFPLFDDPRKRKINLGGASSSASSNSILDQARSLRLAREKEKQKVEGAIKIQSWWRGVREGKEVRKGLVHVVEDAGVEDVGSLRVLRCLVIIGRKALTNRKNAVKGKAPAIASSGADLRRVLGIWSERVLEAGVDDALLRVSRESSPGGQQSWLVLIRQISAMLLWIGTTGESSGASRLNHLTVLTALFKSPLAGQELVPYILKHDYYTLLSAGVHSVPEPERSKSPLTPVLIELAVLPLTTLSASSNAEQHSYALTELLATIFAIPLLPNILPPTSITLLSSQTPFNRLHLLDLPRLMQETNSSQKMHLLATMMVFVTVKRWEMIRKKGGDAVKGYLNLMTALVNSLPAKTLRPPTTASKTANSMVFYPEADEDEPDDDDMDVDSGIRVTTVTSFATTPNVRLEKAPVPDAKTSKRIQTLTSPAYIHSLLPVLSSPSLTTSLVPYLLSLSLAFPSSVPQSLLASSHGHGLIRELYRGSVRRSSIGKEGSTIRSIGGKEAASDWPALLLLVELYGTSLMTMGDDEFFGTANNSVSSGSVHALGASGGPAGASSVSQSRNPLTLDELASFGRQLLNVSWVMWWQMGDLIKESESVGSGSGVGSEGVRRVGWESVRGRVTRCLTGIHARDSRKPFVPKDHWLVTPAQIGDVQGFVDAAVYEERQLSEDPEALEAIQNALPTNLPPPRFSRSRNIQDQSARLSQHLTPRLGILNNLPFAIPFNLRVSIFRHFVLVDMNPAAVNRSFGASSRRLPRPVRRHLPRMRRTQPDDGSVTPPRPSSLPLPRRRTRGAVSIDTGFGIEELIVDTDPEERRAIFGDQADSPIALMPGQPDQGHSHGVEEMVRRAQEEGRRVTIIPPGFEDGPGQPQTWDQAVTDIDNGMQAAVVNQMMGGGWRGKQRVQIRRTNVAQDGFDRLGDKDLKQPIEIVFLDQWGQEESGIDGGGLFKEFFTSLCKEVFDTDRGLWLANKKNELYPNPISYATESHSLEWYRFIGRILGKAMYDGILVDVAFAGFFLAKWLGKQSFLDDLASLDPDLYNGLVFLKHFNGNVEDLSLNFTVAIDEFGETKSIDLIPNGSNISVTRENRLQYIQLMSHYRLVTQIKKQSEAFFEGLSEMIDTRWIRMFNQQEVQVLIGGVNAPINLEDLRKHTNYGGLYDDDHAVIRAFWAVVEGFNQEQRMALLRFVTSCSRPPLLGFKELIPNFSIRDAGTDDLRLPTASTCVNLLKLPRYTTESQLRQKLLQAINANAGFDLS